MARIEIKRRKNTDDQTDEIEIRIDGHKINGVRKYTLSEEGGTIPILTLEVEAWDEMNVDVEANLLFEDDGQVNLTLVKCDDAILVVKEDGKAA